MPGIFLIFLIGAAFYLFIAFGAEDAIKIVLAAVWAILILSIPASLLYEIFR